MSDDAQRQQLRATFEDVAEAYDRARPGYPPELIDDLVAVAQLQPGDHVLEIGCGTGQGSRPLAERGLRIVNIAARRRA